MHLLKMRRSSSDARAASSVEDDRTDTMKKITEARQIHLASLGPLPIRGWEHEGRWYVYRSSPAYFDDATPEYDVHVLRFVTDAGEQVPVSDHGRYVTVPPGGRVTSVPGLPRFATREQAESYAYELYGERAAT